MTDEQIWNDDEPIGERLWGQIEVPLWIESDISPADVAAINQGGCASGAYMPAVTYHKAAQTMAEHGDSVLEYIEERLGELPAIESGSSWSQIACHFLSTAVELWASDARDVLDAFEPEEEDETETAA